jgi:hypothetical protein
MVHHRLLRFARVSVALVVAALCGLVVVACDKMPLTAPSGSAITLVATPTVLPSNGAADITAIVIEGAQGASGPDEPGQVVPGVGTPVHDGTHVVFTTTLGRVEPAEAQTVAGRATVRLIADGRSGTATVRAISGGATSTLEVDIGAASATRIAVTATPQTLPPAGGSSAISARVEDQQGNGVSGTLVSFSTSRGTLSQTSGVTNEHGFASTTLSTTAEATVTATSGGSATALNGTVTVTLKPATTISITPPASAMLGVPAAFTITPGTTTLITDVDVDFGDGEDVSLGAISSATNVSHLFRETGEVTVRVTARDSAGDETTVSTNVSVVPLTATGAASPLSDTEPEVGDTVTFTVTPAAGAAVDRYRWDFGDGQTLTSQSNQITHKYNASGTKVVSVRVFPFGSDEFTTVLIVVDVKP